ncbi:MAG: tyrosine-type recombinase/integrase [Dissulfurispiraceae bacterium]
MGEITLRQALDEYKEIYMASRNFAERTRVEYFNDLEDLIQFLEHLGLKKAGEIELPQLERYLAELDRRGLAGTTRKRKVVSIRSFLSYLYHDQYMNTNLANRIIPPFAEAKSPRYLTKSEYERLLEVSAHNPQDFALIQLVLQTGIKLSELTQLTINDVELPARLFPEMKEAGDLNVRGDERKKSRILPLNYKACIALGKYFRRRRSISNPALFINRFGQPLGPRGIEKKVKKYLAQASITGANVQSLRHTFGVHHLTHGTNQRTIRETMGLRGNRSMEIYAPFVRGSISREFQENAL